MPVAWDTILESFLLPLVSSVQKAARLAMYEDAQPDC